jgi:hypothetical protein
VKQLSLLRVKALFQNLPRETVAGHPETPVRIVGVPVEIRTRNFPIQFSSVNSWADSLDKAVVTVTWLSFALNFQTRLDLVYVDGNT